MEAAADAKRKNSMTLQWITKRVRWAKRMKRVRTIQCRLMGRPSVLVGWYPQWLRLSLFSCPVWFLHSVTPRFTVLKACKENRRTVFSASTWVEKPMKDYWRFEPEPNVTLVILHYAKDRPGTVSGTSMSCTRNSNFQTWNGVMLLCTSTLEEGWTLALSSAQISMIPFNNNEENTAVFFFLYKQPVLKPMYNKIDHDRTRRLGCTRRCDCSMAMHVAPSICFTYWHCENMGVGDFLHLFLYSSYLKDPYSPYLSGISIFSTCKEMNMFLEVFFLKSHWLHEFSRYEYEIILILFSSKQFSHLTNFKGIYIYPKHFSCSPNWILSKSVNWLKSI